MAHDAGILEQPLDIGFGESRDLAEIETGKGGAEIVTLGEDRAPRQAGLEAFEAQLLEQAVIVIDRTAPFIVVIGDVVGLRRAPKTAGPAVSGRETSTPVVCPPGPSSR